MNMEHKIEQQPRKTIRHYNIPYHAHFLTFSCFQQLSLFSRERTKRWIIEAIINAKEKYKYALWAYVIMPEHIHLLVYPMLEKYNISLFLKTIKQSVARKAKHYLKENNPDWLSKLTVKRGPKNVFRFWQTGPGYDRNINSENELFEKIHYIPLKIPYMTGTVPNLRLRFAPSVILGQSPFNFHVPLCLTGA